MRKAKHKYPYLYAIKAGIELTVDSLRPIAREIKFRLQNNQAEAKLRQEVTDVSQQWEKIIQDSAEIIKQTRQLPAGKHVVYVTGYGVGAHFLTLEPILMMSLFVRGCKVSSLFCNGSLPACEFNVAGNNCPAAANRWKKGLTQEAIMYFCNKCKNNVKTIYEKLPIDLYPYNNYIVPEDLAIAEETLKKIDFESFRQWEYEGVKVGEEAFSSVLRATFGGTINDTLANRSLVDRYLYAGIVLTRALKKAYTALKPDRVMVIHGVYLTHGLAAKVANSMNIPVIVVGGGGIRKDTAVFCHKETYHRQLISEPNSLWENTAINEEQKGKVLDYALKKRNAGAGVDYLNYHPNPVEDTESLYRMVGIDRSRPIISIFTNVTWDAQILYSSNVFLNIFNWIFTTIEEIGKNNKVWAVIRVHPAESKGEFPTKQPIIKEINKRFKKLPDNIRVIPPESNISSYTLAQESKAALIYGTKMGLEIALMKIPLIICGETFSRGKGYGLDITSLQQYLDLLRNIQNYPPMGNEQYDRALRYAHYFYFCKMLDLPFSTRNAKVPGGGKTINFHTLNELLPGKKKEIDAIYEGIINLKPIYLKE
ncbi:MAG: hypothetical protein PHH44_02405 [bacterium]|nr:hypothetical protein [bacterium]